MFIPIEDLLNMSSHYLISIHMMHLNKIAYRQRLLLLLKECLTKDLKSS